MLIIYLHYRIHTTIMQVEHIAMGFIPKCLQNCSEINGTLNLSITSFNNHNNNCLHIPAREQESNLQSYLQWSPGRR